MNKSPDAFRTISEVADWLNTPAHVLRFWESRFSQVKPVKRAGGRRYYRPADMALLGGIKQLLHDDGMTIRGVQKLLREQGVLYVAEMSPAIEGVADTATPQRRNVTHIRNESAAQDEPKVQSAALSPVDEFVPDAPMAEDVPIDAFDAPEGSGKEASVVPFTRSNVAAEPEPTFISNNQADLSEAKSGKLITEPHSPTGSSLEAPKSEFSQPAPSLIQMPDIPNDPNDDAAGLDVDFGLLGHISALRLKDKAMLAQIMSRADALHNRLMSA